MELLWGSLGQVTAGFLAVLEALVLLPLAYINV